MSDTDSALENNSFKIIDKMKIRLKENLALLLKSRSLNASQLARIAKVSKSSLSDWSAGRPPRSLEQLKSVSDALGVSVDEILFSDLSQETLVKTKGEKALLQELLGETVLEGTYHLTVRKVKL